jgi:hypothetical protein
MPTVLRLDGLRVSIYVNDHHPAHVHVIGPDAEAAFNLNCPAGPVRARENFGFSLSRLTKIEKLLQKHVEQLCRAWEDTHGIA